MRIPLAACGACCLLAATVAAQSTQTRFQEMDDNSDGVITRNEWRGSSGPAVLRRGRRAGPHRLQRNCGLVQFSLPFSPCRLWFRFSVI